MSRPFAQGAVIAGVHSTGGEHAGDAIAQVFAQARVADQAGFDGVTISEHHGGAGGPGYLPNPMTVAGWLLPELERAWAAAAPLLLPLRSPNQVIEEMAWLAARFPGRTGLCVGPGFAPLDFEAAEVPLEDRHRRFRSGLSRLAAAFVGEPPEALRGDPAVAALVPGSVPLVSTLGGPVGATAAGRAKAGAMVDSFASDEKARVLFERYAEAGGPGPRILCRRVWLGAPDPGRMQSLASGYRGIGSATAIGAPQTDFIATTDVEEMAGLLAASAGVAGADSLLLRFFFRGVSQADMEEQLGETGSRMLPHLRRELAAP